LNRPQDVRQIQSALNRFSPEVGGPNPLLSVDGILGPRTKAAIHHFQEKWNITPRGSKNPDDVVDVNGPTIKRLRAGPGARTTPALDFLKFIPRVTEILTASRAALDLAKVGLDGSGLGFGTQALARADRHFHVTATATPRTRLNEIDGNYFRMQTAIGYIPRGLVLAVPEPPAVAIGAWMFSYAGGYDSRLKFPKDDPNYIEEDENTPPQSIYICPKARTLNNDGFAYVMIHELAHFTSPFGAAGNHDFAYFHRDPARYRGLDPEQAFHNADCYSQFAFDAIGRPDFNIVSNQTS
jgi:peptidoglycan hydrolase-like protein with peptidoglycan-binding domain